MCIFCKIINNEIPSARIYEDDKVVAFLDLSQVTKGHTLVVPKQHSANILECDPETAAHLMNVGAMLGKRICERLNAKGMNILLNTNEVAGQSVFHTHMHLIPRYSEDDAVKIEFNESATQNLDELKDLLK